MTFVVLTSPWTRPAAWTAASARHRSRPIRVVSSALSGPSCASHCSSVFPVTQALGPQPHAAVVDVGTVHDDDVGVAHPCQATRLLDEVATGCGRRGLLRSPELKCDLPVEERVVGPEHLTEAPVTELLENLEVSPF